MKFKNTSKKVAVDTGSRITYSLVVGAGIDYFLGGLTGWGIVASRATATGVNSVTSGPYGWWQDKWYSLLKTTPETRKINDIFNSKNISDYVVKEKFSEVTNYLGRRSKQFVTDMLAFNTFETLVYDLANCAGQLFDTGDADFHQVFEGMKGIVYISPFVAPTMRMTMQGARKLFGVKTSAQKAQENLDTLVCED